MLYRARARAREAERVRPWAWPGGRGTIRLEGETTAVPKGDCAMTTVLAVYQGGVLRPVQPLPLNEGETVEIALTRPEHPSPPASVEESERRIREAGTLQEWIEAANALPVADDGYDLLRAVNENRHSSERPLIPPAQEGGRQ